MRSAVFANTRTPRYQTHMRIAVTSRPRCVPDPIENSGDGSFPGLSLF